MLNMNCVLRDDSHDKVSLIFFKIIWKNGCQASFTIFVTYYRSNWLLKGLMFNYILPQGQEIIFFICPSIYFQTLCFINIKDPDM